MRLRSLNQYILAIVLCLMLLTPVHAGVKGQCANCHTMHNSQDGIDLETTPSPNLTKGNCVGCHTGDNTGANTTPYVLSTIAPYDTSLAGGNFYWVLQDDRMGHNVSGIPTMTGDGVLDVAPGDDGTGLFCTDSCHASLYTTTLVDTGCEGCHIDTKHHAPAQAVGTPATEEHGYYRFLSGHSGGNGVHGIEDPKWEYMADMQHHNEYLGDPDKDSNAPTMTNYCVGCHGNFHDQQDLAGNWIRHPSDAVIPSDGEYTELGFYDPDVPIARPDLAAIGDPAIIESGDMVMCLSCHRAHGSPYPDALRWDYTHMKAGDGGDASGTGCFKCHSDKD